MRNVSKGNYKEKLKLGKEIIVKEKKNIAEIKGNLLTIHGEKDA